MNDRLLTFTEAAELMRVSLRTIRRIVDSGSLAVIRLGERTLRIRSSEIERYLEENTLRYSGGIG